MISWSGDKISPMSNLIALIASVVMIYIPLLAYGIIFRTPNLNNETFQKRYKTFIVDLRTDTPFGFHFITVFFFRRAVYA